MIRVMIADDEPLAREGLRRCLAAQPDVELLGEAHDGPDTVDRVLADRPELLFLDVQMPGFDGFEVVARIRDTHLPLVVFVSAYDRYALRAFDVHAVDYLLKPFPDDRFEEAMVHARRSLTRPDSERTARILALLSDVVPERVPQAYLDRLTVSERNEWRLVRVDEIDWFESAGNYVQLRAGHASHLVRMTLSNLERALDPRRFARIHRTTIVNLDRVRLVRPAIGEGFDVELEGGQIVHMSQRFRGRLLR